MKQEQIRFRAGHKLKAIRERRGLTLKSLGELAGLSSGMLSQIENNKVSPSVDSLLHICSILEIDLEYLFQDYRRNKQVDCVKKEEREYRTKGNILYEKLTSVTGGDKGIEAFELTIPAGEERGDAEYGHKGWEFGVITEGKGTLLYGTQQHELEPGDSISFESDIPHILRNRGKSLLKAYWILTAKKD